jgi:hypothetical protein
VRDVKISHARFVISYYSPLPFATVAAGFAFFTADLSAAARLAHAVSFPCRCTETIHFYGKRLGNVHLSVGRWLLGRIINRWRGIIFMAAWHADG